VKITIHPLFLAVGLLSALFGGLPIFIICALTALLHECGHIFCAARLGFECKKISLMPFGAAAVCDIEGISPSDEVKLALAGPLVNLLLCVAVAGLWWFIPETYVYTDLIFYSSAGMLVLNLLPAYPLDGGRIVKCIFGAFLKKDRALKIALRAMNIVVVIVIVIIYVFAVRNLSLLSAAVLLLCSALAKSPPAVKINFAAKKKKKGREIRYVILDENATFKDALRFVDSSRFLVLQLYGEKFIDEITEDELYEKLLTRSIYDKILE
jgi:stage IV sporulation protein FB